MTNKPQKPAEQIVTAPAMVVAPGPKPAQVGDINTAPTTTAAQDMTTHSQRRVNLIWESMQAVIAAGTVGTALYISSRLCLMVLMPAPTERQFAIANTAFMLVSNLVSLIIGFYFGRTNHHKTGGVITGDAGR